MDEVCVRKCSETATRNINAGDTATDDCQEYKTVNNMGQPHDTCSFDGNNEGASECASAVYEVVVVVRDAHSHQPDVHDEEGKHAPEDWIDCLLDCSSRTDGFSGNNGNMFA